MSDSHHVALTDGGIQVGDTVKEADGERVGEVVDVGEKRIAVDFGDKYPYACLPEHLEVIDP